MRAIFNQTDDRANHTDFDLNLETHQSTIEIRLVVVDICYPIVVPIVAFYFFSMFFFLSHFALFDIFLLILLLCWYKIHFFCSRLHWIKMSQQDKTRKQTALCNNELNALWSNQNNNNWKWKLNIYRIARTDRETAGSRAREKCNKPKSKYDLDGARLCIPLFISLASFLSLSLLLYRHLSLGVLQWLNKILSHLWPQAVSFVRFVNSTL